MQGGVGMHRRAQYPAYFEIDQGRAFRLLMPPVYRYLPKKFCDQFWETGDIQLSSFASFAKHEDEARGDVREGFSSVSAVSADRSFGVFKQTGLNAFVLCGSTILGQQILSQFEGCDDCIEITDVARFGIAIARQIAGYRFGLAGHCIYGERGIIREMKGEFPALQSDGVTTQDLFEASQNAAQYEDYLLKEARYSPQSEYRMVWLRDDSVEGPLVVRSLDAREFCRKVDASELV